MSLNARYIVLITVFLCVGTIVRGQDMPVSGKTDNREVEQFDFANGLFSRGMYDMAIEEYSKFINTYPDSQYHELAYYRIGESYFLNKKYAEAFKIFDYFKQRFTSENLVKKASLREGQIKYFEEEYEKAYRILSGLSSSKETPEVSAAAGYYMASILIKEEKTAEAETILKNIVKEYPGTEYVPFAYMNLGDIYIDAEKYGEAETSFGNVIAAGRDDETLLAKAYLRSGDASYLRGDYTTARGFYDKAVNSRAASGIYDEAAMGLISSYYNSADYQGVIDHARGVAEKVNSGETKAQILFFLGNSLFHKDIYDEATKVYEEASLKYPDTKFGKKSRLNECWALFRSGDTEASLRKVNDYLDLPGDSMDEALYLKAKVLEKTGKSDKALELYARIMEEFKESGYYKEALYETGWIHDKTGRIEEAVMFYRRFVNGFSDDKRSPEVLLKTGQDNLRLKRYAEAEEDYRSFLSKYPGDPLKENVLYQLGNVYIKTGDYARLIDVYSQFMKEYPGSDVINSVIYWTGRGYQEIEDWDSAIGEFAKLKGEDEFSRMGRESTAYSLFQKGEPGKAAEIYYQLVKDFEDYVLPEGVYRWVGEYYFDQGKSDKAVFVFTLFEKTHPDKASLDGAVDYMTGESLRRSGDQAGAEARFLRVIDRKAPSPYYERAYLGLGKCWFSRGEYEKAIESFENALDAHGDNMVGAHARFEIGKARDKLGQYREAAKSFLMVAILYEDKELCPEALYNAGRAFAQAGDEDKSINTYKELVDRYPDHPLADEAGEKIREVTVEKQE